TNVRNWPQIHPASKRVPVSSKDAPLFEGDTFEEIIAAGWRRRRMSWVVTSCDSPRLWTVEGHSLTGSPLRSRIRYRLSERDGTTTFVRELRYSVAHPLLRVLNRIYFQHRISRESESVLVNLKRRCER